MTESVALSALPAYPYIPAAHGALMSPTQLSGSSVFDIVVTIIMIELGDG